jgi:hypothetical protein
MCGKANGKRNSKAVWSQRKPADAPDNAFSMSLAG